MGGKVIDIPYTQGISSSMLNQRLKEIGTTPEVRMKRLRRLIASKPIVRILESHSGLTGLIAENACVEVNNVKREFDGMWRLHSQILPQRVSLTLRQLILRLVFMA